MKRLFLLDFDHTLFDTEQLKASISIQLETVLQQKTVVDGFWQTLHSFRHQPFYIQEGIKQFCETHQFISQREAIYNAFLHQNFASFVYPDVLPAISNLSQVGQPAIFTTGDALYQQVKVQQSGIGEKMKFVYIFDNKMDHFSEVLARHPETEVWYIDNQLLLLEKAFQINDAVKTVWMKRTEYPKETEFQPTVTISNLSEFVKYLNLKIENYS